jgi:hypothetical protein
MPETPRARQSENESHPSSVIRPCRRKDTRLPALPERHAAPKYQPEKKPPVSNADRSIVSFKW